MRNFNLETFLISLVVIVCSIALHEFGHAISADRLGDEGPRRDGRISLWPDKHFEPFGFLMILVTLVAGFGLGWGKPVMVNPRRFRNPNRDMLIVAICGPLMNLLLAVVAGLILRFVLPGNFDFRFTIPGKFVYYCLSINLSLMFFNLIPITPLDGSKVLAAILPTNLSLKYQSIMGQYGSLLLIMLLITGATSHLIAPAVITFAQIIVGPIL